MRVVTRRWIRRDSPIWPYVWRGLLPTLGLAAAGWYAAGPFAVNDVEASVREHIRAQLDASGHSWATMKVSGQHVMLSGTPAGPGAGDAALAVARAARCPTWAGPQICAVDVTGLFAQASAAPPTAPAAPLAAAPTPEAVAKVKAAAQACETALARVVERSKIEFATGLAEITPRSAPLLDTLARTARDCPGTLHVQGHTDARGTRTANMALSQARSEAVRQALVNRGLAAQRVVAEGFGPDKPLGDNSTDEGRARNRRIDFRVVTDGR